jgi:tetrahydromethanopterin:alpha-L-glutamate ligase
MRAARHVVIFSDAPDWHARRLTSALASHGVASSVLSLMDCTIDTAAPIGLRVPGFEDTLPDGALVRLISSGTLEQITLRLGMLHAMEAMGVVTYNDARCLERTVDKSMTSFLVRNAGLPTPPTWVTENAEQARTIVAAEIAAGEKVVVKPLFGSQGVGLRLLETPAIPEPAEVNGAYYLQRFIDTGTGSWHDWRIFVAGDRAIAAMIRRGRHWITNVMQGAECEATAAEGEPAHLAVAAARAVGAGYAGVDIVRDRDGKFLILEVNSVPAWKGLQSVTDFDVAQAIVDDFLTRLPQAGSRAAVS